MGMIATLPFGRTGRRSPRLLFGAAALAGMRQARADQVMELLLEFGIDHIDTAASYGESELRLAPWMQRQRHDFFLASKTGARGRAEARESIHRSLERLGVDQLDLIQLHDLSDEEGWQRALGDDGALQAAVQARDEGLVRFIGVTGHGTQVARMHLRSLERFPFDSVLLPYNFTLMESPEYARDFEALLALCQERQVAVQTIKALARRRWRDDDTSPRYSWYEPIRDPDALRRAVHWVLDRPGVFLNTSSDATLLRASLEAASEHRESEDLALAVARDAEEWAMEPLFVRGVADAI